MKTTVMGTLCLMFLLLGPRPAGAQEEERSALRHFARQGFDFTTPPHWGYREVSPDEVEFVGPSNGTFAPRIQVKRLIDVLFVGDRHEELREAFLDEFRRLSGQNPELLRDEIVTENGRDFLHLEARTRMRGESCRIIRRYSSSAERGYEMTYYDMEKVFTAQEAALRTALASFDTEGEAVSEWTLIYEIAIFLVLAAAGVWYWLDRKRERRVVGEVDEPEINLRSADGEFILPIEDIESPGRVVARRGSHGPSRDGGVNEYDISFFGGGDEENKTL